MSDKRRDIVVFCSHGHADQRGVFVQRFRWDGTAWDAVDTHGEKVNTIGGPVAPFLGPESLADAPAGRRQFNVYCPRCRALVAMRQQGAQVALSYLSSQGFSTPTPLFVLRHAYERVPQQLR